MCAAGSRRTFHPRSQPPQCARSSQASLSYHHSRVHGKRRYPHRIRDHGWLQSAPGACAVCVEHCRLRDERPGCGRGAAFYHSQRVSELRYCNSETWEEHTSQLQSRVELVCHLLLEEKCSLYPRVVGNRAL